MGRIDGKIVIITGAANGIGATAARRFVHEGASVLLVDRDEAGLKAIVSELPADRASSCVADVTDEAATKAFVDATVERFGRVDAALLNAGIETDINRIQDTPVATFDRVMAVNVRSVWLGLAAIMPIMRANGGGSIVITSSISGLRGSALQAPYNASKHAVIGLMKSAALDGAKDKIRVNTINPGGTKTRMMAAIDQGMDAAGQGGIALSRIPMGRYAEPSEIASMMLFLVSDESSFCTGASYLVDGGSMS
jgi:NAD(P)-dependent dehydrogenase (short-subunit alcohol dehydrogenase family)